MQPYTREYQGHIYSDLEYVLIDPELLGDLVRAPRPADFYSALDGVTRHKIGSQWFCTADSRYRLILAEMQCVGDIPEFTVSCSYIPTPTEQGQNTSLHSWSILEYPGIAFCTGMEELLAKVQHCVKLIAADRSFKAMSLDEKFEYVKNKYATVTP